MHHVVLALAVIGSATAGFAFWTATIFARPFGDDEECRCHQEPAVESH